MELLIPGLILVALMVYASTRIKKSAAAAFEAESIAGPNFTIDKPEGFLSVVNGKPELEFEAYSRDFGGEGAEDIRQARAEIRRLDGVEKFVGVSEVVDGRKYVIAEMDTEEKGVALREITKTVETATGPLQLKVTRLAETNDEMLRKIEMMIASFRLTGGGDA